MSRALTVAGDANDRTFALTHLGDLAFNAGDLGTAARHYDEGLARQPGQAALLAGRARVRAARGDLTGAITDLREATAVLPTVDHLVTLADTLTAAGRTAEAAQTVELIRATTALPGTSDIDLVLFHADHGDPRTAVTRGARLLAGRPSVSVRIAYAWALHSAGRDRDALTQADRSLGLGTRDARAHYYRGMIRLALRDREGARADLRQALRINPYFGFAYARSARTSLAALDGPA
jgi:tetratricopeptide (TPR) repeat protein